MPDGAFANGAEIISERIGLTNRIGAILATLGVSDYNPLLRNRGRRLAELRTALGEPLPANAHAKLKRLLAPVRNWCSRRSLSWSVSVMRMVETEASDGASKMIQQLTALRGIGVTERDRAGAGGVRASLCQWQGTRIIRWSGFFSI